MLCLCFQVQSPLLENPSSLLLGGEASLQRPPSNKIGKRIKNGVFLMKRVSSRKDGVFSFEKGMFPSQKGCGIEIISPATYA